MLMAPAEPNVSGKRFGGSARVPARKRAAGARSFIRGSQSFSRFALICGRDARDPANRLLGLALWWLSFGAAKLIGDVQTQRAILHFGAHIFHLCFHRTIARLHRN